VVRGQEKISQTRKFLGQPMTPPLGAAPTSYPVARNGHKAPKTN